MNDQMPEVPGDDCGKKPWVATASFQREGDNMVATLDGEELVIPGGNVSVNSDEDGKVAVHLYASFKAGAVDILAEEHGS